MSEWVEFSLGQCVDVLDNMRVPISGELRSAEPGATPYYGANGLQGYIKGHIFDEPLILIAEDGGYFEEFADRPIAYRIKGRSWVNNHAHVLRPKEAFDFDFLFYSLQHKDIVAFIRGGTRAKLNQSELREIRITAPRNRGHQRKIATILSTIDTAIEQTEALIEKYQHIKAGLMHDLFTRGVLPTGQLRPPREQAPELYQETAIGWIPREWRFGPIGAYFEIQLGKMLNQLAKTGRNSFPYLGNRSVQWNRLDLDSLELMDFSADEQKKFALKNGDLLVCEGGEVGRTAIWDSQMENCFYQKAIHRLRAKDTKVKPRFMLWYMHFAQSNGQFADFTSQSSIAHLTQEKLAKVPILAPSTQEQDLIISRIDAHEAVIEGQRRYLANLRAQKLGLMQDLLTGKVAVQVNAPAPEAVA